MFPALRLYAFLLQARENKPVEQAAKELAALEAIIDEDHIAAQKLLTEAVDTPKARVARYQLRLGEKEKAVQANSIATRTRITPSSGPIVSAPLRNEVFPTNRSRNGPPAVLFAAPAVAGAKRCVSTQSGIIVCGAFGATVLRTRSVK